MLPSYPGLVNHYEFVEKTNSGTIQYFGSITGGVSTELNVSENNFDHEKQPTLADVPIIVMDSRTDEYDQVFQCHTIHDKQWT
jgi:hypothetical protein